MDEMNKEPQSEADQSQVDSAPIAVDAEFTQTLPEEEQKPVKLNIFGKPKKEKPKKSVQREIFEWVMMIVCAVLLAFVIRTFLFELVSVDGNSMYATLHDGEVMLVDKREYSAAVLPWGTYAVGGEPERFDVVICHYPDRGNTNFVKRVVGLPGDTISIVNGYLYVNGEQYEEPYLVNRPNYSIRGYVVPEGMYFVLGDNRSNSNDSHIVGPIDRSMILGHVVYVLKPAEGEVRRAIPNGLEDSHERVLEEGL